MANENEFKQDTEKFVQGLENKLVDAAALTAWAVMRGNAKRDKKCKGLKRTASSRCCKYCTSLEGTYTSAQVDAGKLGGRHEACKCKITPVFEEKSKRQKEKVALHIGRSLGAKAMNYTVRYPNGYKTLFVEGSDIIERKVFAGKGSEPFKELRVRQRLADEYGGNPDDWKHVAGRGLVYEPVMGKIGRAEVHWMQNDEIGRYEEFVFKNWIKRKDES